MANYTLPQIESFIQKGDLETARNALRDLIQSSPTADTYYLAAQAAVNDAQKRIFLQKALELDPFHASASEALDRFNHPTTAQPVTQIHKPAVNGIAEVKLPGNIKPRQIVIAAVALVIVIAGFGLLSNMNTENTVRAESIKALEAAIIEMNEGWSEKNWGKVGDEELRIISVQRSTEKQDILGSDSELWCVTFMPPITKATEQSPTQRSFQVKNAFVMRTGLIWEVRGWGFGPNRSEFLEKGCSNWLEEGDVSDTQ